MPANNSIAGITRKEYAVVASKRFLPPAGVRG